MAENHLVPNEYLTRFSQADRVRLARISVAHAIQPAQSQQAEGISCEELRAIADQLERDGNMVGAAVARQTIADREREDLSVDPATIP